MTMATKQKPAASAKAKYPRREMPCPAGHTEDETGLNFGRLVTSPELAAYRVITTAEEENISSKIDTPGLVAVLREQFALVNRNDLSHAEAMLIGQATAFQTLFSRLASKAMGQTYTNNMESLMRMALRAQNQCRMTLETLNTLKNPPVVYARQANISNGPQQINNSATTPSRARETDIEPNQLLEQQHGERLDLGTAGQTSGVDTTMATVGTIDRA